FVCRYATLPAECVTYVSSVPICAGQCLYLSLSLFISLFLYLSISLSISLSLISRVSLLTPPPLSLLSLSLFSLSQSRTLPLPLSDSRANSPTCDSDLVDHPCDHNCCVCRLLNERREHLARC